ncbi:hypothetical protein [Falsihalocynthiibacter arcticus]|uniref:hypothetical protein n=1 Tax=Falsihalocynthiibacter arcticus TaxID=1579316 RepID=UPI003001004E
MMFEQILETLSENGKSGQAYAKVIVQAENAMKEDSERAAGYLLLKILADRFIETTGRLATTAAQTKTAFTEFSNHVSTLKDAYTTGDPSTISNALNEVSLASLEPFDPSFPAI